ncbi:tetratricopeptide repeat protein [Chryseobacterium metallicongregator]|nr:LuxR family transcriptional regulator [Chryseobacterium sp. ES2]
MADEKLKKFNDAVLTTRLNIIYGKNYHAIGLYKESLLSFNKAIRLAYRISDKEDRNRRLNYIYNQKMIAFQEKGIMDSVYAMERKLPVNSELFVSRAERNLKRKKLDSAEYYLNKANSFFNQVPAESKSRILLSYGELYFEKKEYEEALKYYFQSLELVRKIGLKKSERVIYQHIYEVYKKQNDIERANIYLEKYTILSDSLNSVERNILDIPIRKIINENIESEKQEKYIFYYIFAGVVLLSIILLAFLRKSSESREKQKDILIKEKERETEILKKKLSSSIDELVQLAIHNNPVFLGKFEEAYPQFYNSLLLQCPNITPKEIKLCALVRLNFSNKEIAQYNHISIRTVESQKYRLRKKLGVAGDIDFNQWILML